MLGYFSIFQKKKKENTCRDGILVGWMGRVLYCIVFYYKNYKIKNSSHKFIARKIFSSNFYFYWIISVPFSKKNKKKKKYISFSDNSHDTTNFLIIANLPIVQAESLARPSVNASTLPIHPPPIPLHPSHISTSIQISFMAYSSIVRKRNA